MKKWPFVLILILSITGFKINPMNKISIKVDASKVQYTMKGGMGASWHAISEENPLNNEKYQIPVREVGSRGSAYGGNPPVSNTKAWKQIQKHASWLGMNFVRVELSQRMYEPERQQFTWDSEEMQTLYNILDWAEAHDVDVFLQQMWMAADWNSLPKIHPLISAPKNLDDFANSIATLLEYLIDEKGYTCIKYFCMTNEPPGGTWGYWWEYGENPGQIEDAWARLNQEFKDRGIDIPISGPDWTDMPPFEEEKLGMADSFGAIDIHSYHGVTDEGEANLKNWAAWAHAQGKPFFLTEYGNMNLGWGTDDPNQKSFEAALSNACDVIRGLRVGVDAFNRWSFTNRGDLDGQWQLIKTFDLKTRKYLDEVIPEPEAYYGFGVISRFLSKYSKVLSLENGDDEIFAVALESPEGAVSIVMVNAGKSEKKVELEIANMKEALLHHYLVTKELVNQADFELKPIESFKSSMKIKVNLPAQSISNISSYHLSPEEEGIF